MGLFQPATRTPADTYLIDQAYIIQEIAMPRPGEWRVGLKYGNITFRAELVVSTPEVQALLVQVEEAHERRTEIAPDLQVNAQVTAKGVRKARVVGIGAKRPNSMGLAQALAAEKAKADAGK
jgi:hypothetical protein